MKQDAYPDKLILELRRKCRQEQPDALVGEQKEFKRVILCDGLCTIRLPSYMHAMKQRERLIKYRNAMMPEIIIADGNSDATFTFSPAGQAYEMQNLEQGVERLRQDMQKVWKQAVFYDMGIVKTGEVPVSWMDCKTFCLDGSLYCLLFLFEIQGQLILGNFHCSFSKYDRWKPTVLRVLETIEEEGGYHERLSVKD